MNPILAQLGLTPEMIMRHVVSVDRRTARPDYDTKMGWYKKQTALRAARRAQGLHVLTGQPLKRSPNGTRQPRRR